MKRKNFEIFIDGELVETRHEKSANGFHFTSGFQLWRGMKTGKEILVEIKERV